MIILIIYLVLLALLLVSSTTLSSYYDDSLASITSISPVSSPTSTVSISPVSSPTVSPKISPRPTAPTRSPTTQVCSCYGYCGSDTGCCWCDSSCVDFDDCCSDYQGYCTSPTAAPTPLLCAPYSASNTNSATQNYITCNYTLTSITAASITASTCVTYNGDTYLKAYVNGKMIASNDDGCAGSTGASSMIFILSSGDTVTIREGCYSSSYCSGTVALSISPLTPMLSQREYNALYEFYMSTNGPDWSGICNNWIFLSTPNYNAPCNGWYGITCNSQSQVIEIDLIDCHLTGTIPTQLGYMTSMQELSLSSNSLTGTIPTQLGYMASMQQLSLADNSLTGPIPTELGSVTSTIFLWLNDNRLTGPIPTQLGSMTSIYSLGLEDNRLTGPIPSQLGSMTSMRVLYLSNNSLTGTIPPQLWNLNSLTSLGLNDNRLTGPIPTQLGSMTSIYSLSLDSNSFTGPIPSQLGNMISMSGLYLSNNSLTGTIPSELGSMIGIFELYLSSNSLTGYIPSELGDMTTMSYLSLDSNSLTGTLPPQLGFITSLQFLNLSNNKLVGPVPSEIGFMTILFILDISSNSLTGTLPPQLGLLALKSSLGNIFLQNNNLIGSVPSGILTTNLLSINLSNNKQLGGTIQSLFNTSTDISLMKLQSLIVSNMNLVGTLPELLFTLPLLTTLVLSSNPLSGTLPASICKSSLTSLYLDGIGVSSEGDSFHGSIPSCIFASTLTTLHLAGNGMTGSLPTVPENSKISILNVARNRLRGDIPVSMQAHSFISVDLSFNKITGTLVGSFEPPLSSLNMTVNRLSGSAPSTLKATNATLNILEGNLFGCPLLSNSESSAEVSCGSSNLDFPFIVWLVLVSTAVVLAAVFMHCTLVSTQNKQLLGWSQSYQHISLKSESNDIYHTVNTMNYLEHACSMSLVLSTVFVLVAMMSWIGVKLNGKNGINSLYQVQYLYTTTSAYLVGVTPTVLIWIYLSLGGMIVLGLCVSIRPTAIKRGVDGRAINDQENTVKAVNLKNVRAALAQGIVGLLVIAAALAINYGFVQIVYFVKPSNLEIIQFMFAVVKAVFSAFVVPASTKLVPKASRQLHTVVMAIVVNIIGPGVATLLSSPLCLYYKLKPNSISVSYTYQSFIYVGGNFFGQGYVEVESTFTPEWFYSYQCSSSFLTSYLPNFVYLYIINGIVTPLVNFLAMFLLSTRYEYFINITNIILIVAQGFKVEKLYYINDRKLPIAIEMSEIDHNDKQEASNSNEQNRTETTTTTTTAAAAATITVRDSNRETIETINQFEIDVSDIIPNLCVDITMMLTFGLASPLLSIIITINIIINVLLFRLALGRYIGIVSKTIGNGACNRLLESTFGDQWRCLSSSWWIMSIFIGMFWSLFVFDILGDIIPNSGLVGAILMVILCPVLFILVQMLLYVNPDSTCSSGSSSMNKYRDRIHDTALWIHVNIWRHIIRTNSISNDVSSSVSSSSITRNDDRISTIIETVSPLGSHNR